MNKYFIQGPMDEAGRIETALTKTATFVGTTLVYPNASFSPGGIGLPMAAFVEPSAVDIADGNEAYAFKLQESTDGGTTWQDTGPSVSVDVTSAATKLKPLAVPGFISYGTLRVTCTISGTTPSITYDAWVKPIADL